MALLSSMYSTHNGTGTACASAGDAEASFVAEAEPAGSTPVLQLWPACTKHAIPALLHALQDYTTDNRGDVGSLCAPCGFER